MMTRRTLLSLVTALVCKVAGGVWTFRGLWDASTNSPKLSDGTGKKDDFYVVSVAGTQNLGSGQQTFAVKDLVVHNGTAWKKSALPKN